MNIKNISLVVALSIFSSFCFGQEKGNIEFSISEYDFGEIQEADGPAIFEFEFTNTGTAPIIISNVKASCGCTTPGWSKEPVMSGEKGFVKAQYNPRNRPGNFRKSLTITSNSDPVTTRVYIKGNVIPRVKTIEEKLSVKVGVLRMKSKSFNLGRMTTEKEIEKSFEIYNDGDSAITFLDTFEGPDFIKFSYEPKILAPKQQGKVIVKYNPVHDDNMGFNNHGVKFSTNETVSSEKNMNVLSTITEYFPPMTDEEYAKAPKLLVADRLQDLGRIKKGEKSTAEFVITNGGDSKLNIRKVKSNCDCFVAELDKYDVKPGKSVTLKGTFDATGRRGTQNKSITIYSNDPKDPTQVVSIKASVISEQ